MENYLVKIKRLNELTQDDLDKRITVPTVYDQKESGILTDFYGAMDSDTHAVVAVELDNALTFYLTPNSRVEID